MSVGWTILFAQASEISKHKWCLEAYSLQYLTVEIAQPSQNIITLVLAKNKYDILDQASLM